MRTSGLLELANPLLAFAVVALAALAHTPAVLVLLAPLWFAPHLASRAGARRLDEREAAIRDRAERLALRALLLLACALPLLGGDRAQAGLSLLQREWADAGMLLVAVFLVRALGFAAGALSASAAAQYAGGVATAMVLAWVVALALVAPPVAPVIVALALLPLLPHVTEPALPRVAGTLWIAGALAATLHAIGTGMVPIEVVVVVLLFAVPWATAGWWSLRARVA